MGEYNSERSECSEGSLDSTAEKFITDVNTTAKLPPEYNLRSSKNRDISTKDYADNGLSSKPDKNGDKDSSHSVHSVHSIHPANDVLKPNLYRIGKTDTIGCLDCRIKGDKWFMDKHSCSRSLSNQ